MTSSRRRRVRGAGGGASSEAEEREETHYSCILACLLACLLGRDFLFGHLWLSLQLLRELTQGVQGTLCANWLSDKTVAALGGA
jgi:hypothetical protein